MAAAIMTVTTTHTSPICTQTPFLMQLSHQPSATISKPGSPPRSPEAQRRQCTKTTCTPALAHTTSHSRPWDSRKPAVQVLGGCESCLDLEAGLVSPSFLGWASPPRSGAADPVAVPDDLCLTQFAPVSRHCWVDPKAHVNGSTGRCLETQGVAGVSRGLILCVPKQAWTDGNG